VLRLAMINPTLQGAYSLALWLRTNAPALYMALAHNAQTVKLGSLGKCKCHGMHGLGQDAIPVDSTPIDTGGPTIDIWGSFPSVPALDTLDPATFAPITVTDPTLTPLPPTQDVTAAPVDNSPGFLSSVANFLTTGGGITSALNLATATVQNQTARTVTTAQIARVAAGNNPAAITYRVNPTTGQVVPTLATPYGAYGGAYGSGIPVTPTILQRLAPNAASLGVTSFVSQNWMWLALAAGVGALVLLRR
jgi:hypothetical protein